MSAPAFAWALERGASLGLKPAERLVLIYLADMANGEKVCWPGQPRIAKFTGLAIRTVIAVLKSLEARQLIRAVSSAGRVTYYHILRDTPANGAADTPVIRPVVTPANGAAVSDAPLQNVQGHPCNPCGEPLHITTQTPANGADDPSSTQEKKTLKPARAGASASPSPLPHGRAVAAPEPPPNTTHNPDAWDDPAVPFDEALAKLPPSRRLHLATPDPDVITEDDLPQTAADMQRMARAALAVMQGAVGAITAPPLYRNGLTRNEQITELVEPPARPERPPPEEAHTHEQQIAAAMAGVTAEQAAKAARAFAARAGRHA